MNRRLRFHPSHFLIQVGAEQMIVTARSGSANPFTYTVTRGVSGTTATTHSAGDAVYSAALRLIGPLAATISSSATTMLVNETSAPPAVPFAAQVDSEQMNVTARVLQSGNEYQYTISRGINGTVAASHNAGAVVDSLVDLLTPSGSGDIWINAANTQGGSIDNVRLRGVRVGQPPYGCVSIPAPYPVMGTLAASIDNVTTTVTVNDNATFLIPATPFVIEIDSEQMNVTARSRSTNPFTYTVTRGYNRTAAASHTAGQNVLNVGAAMISDILIDACDFAPGELDGTVAQVAADGATGVTLRNLILLPQASGTVMSVFGKGSAPTSQVTDLLIDACRFRGIGANVFGINCNNVARAVIQNNIFLAAQSGSQAIELGGSSSGALLVGNDLSAVVSATPVVDNTTGADTISHGNLGYTDRRITRGVTASATATANDDLVWADATSGAVTVTLPAASGRRGRTITVKKVDTSANSVTIARTGSDTIDGGTSYVLAAQNKYATLASDGSSKWYVVANN
jgi:hypothetical protein